MHLINDCSKSLARMALIAVRALPLYPQDITVAPPPTQFGMIGVAASQTLRLSVVAFPPAPIAPPCIAQLSFANIAGGAVGPGKMVNLNARRIWNGMIDRKATLIARCVSPEISR